MHPAPTKLDLKKDQHLRIEWNNGSETTFPIPFLRQRCPCAACKMLREGRDPHQLFGPATPEPDKTGPEAEKPRKSLSLSVLPRHFASEEEHITVTHAELVGNYAIRLHFSDGHESGIFSWAYLRELGG